MRYLLNAALVVAGWMGSVLALELTPHAWQSIEYPPLPSATATGQPARVSLINRGARGLELNLCYFVRAADPKKEAPLPPPDLFSVRVHNARVEPADLPVEMIGGIGGLGGDSYNYKGRMPWGSNTLEESWIEVRFENNTYWLEVPYGFTRNPADAFPDETRTGLPKVARAMANLGEKDWCVAPLYVDYEIGKIQNGWRLTLKMSNPFDAAAEVELYRDDSKVGKSMFLWDLHTPRTGVVVRTPGDGKLESRAMAIRLHEDGMRRSDDFKFNRNPGSDARNWGAVEIRVDDKSYRCTVPSSLFAYVHGAANTPPARRLRAAK
jgi:hypothetical protein